MSRTNLAFPGSVEKLGTAYDMLRRAFGQKGIWATPDAESRYGNTLWMRDFAYALEPVLLRLGEWDRVRTHLENVSRLQRPNGQIPIVFLDDEAAWLDRKRRQEQAAGRKPFMLERYEAGELWNLTPGTRDSEVCYLLAMYQYVEATGDRAFLDLWRPQIDAALAYIETHLLRDGLMIGADWRDTMEKELGDKPLLSNNMLLYRVYEARGDVHKAAALLDRIEATFRVLTAARPRVGRLIDYPGSDRPDPLGAAFILLHGGSLFAATSLWDAALQVFRDLDTPYGVTIKCKHKPAHGGRPDEAQVIEGTDGIVVWPFVQAFVVRALLKAGEHEDALHHLKTLHMHAGFPEWIDPRTGIAYGAPEQLWSAAGYLLARLEAESHFR